MNNKYHVKPNRCRCHPATCCCNEWMVEGPNGKHSTHYKQDTADLVAYALNDMQEKKI